MTSDLARMFEGKLFVANRLSKPALIGTGLEQLDKVLNGGLEKGSVSEWGVPSGFGGRRILIELLKKVSNQSCEKPILWALGQPGVKPFASVWASYGVDLSKVFFSQTFKPLEDLRESFLEPCFSVVVLDNPKSFSKEEYSFMFRQAVKLSMHICILQNYVLSSNIGNVWAHKRINCKGIGHKTYEIEIIRGSMHKNLTITI